MAPDERRVEINISGIPVAGVGGLGLVAMAVLVSVVMPAARSTMLAGLAGGVVLGAALIAARRVWKGSGPSGDDPKILFRELPAEAASRAVARREGRASDSELLILHC